MTGVHACAFPICLGATKACVSSALLCENMKSECNLYVCKVKMGAVLHAVSKFWDKRTNGNGPKLL